MKNNPNYGSVRIDLPTDEKSFLKLLSVEKGENFLESCLRDGRKTIENKKLTILLIENSSALAEDYFLPNLML